MNKLPTVLWDDHYIEDRWGKKRGFMSDMRARGQGPRFLRLSARTARYKPEDVIAYEDGQGFSNTAASMASDFMAPPATESVVAFQIESPRKRKKGSRGADHVENLSGSNSNRLPS